MAHMKMRILTLPTKILPSKTKIFTLKTTTKTTAKLLFSYTIASIMA
jgi:hypothetical protein